MRGSSDRNKRLLDVANGMEHPKHLKIIGIPSKKRPCQSIVGIFTTEISKGPYQSSVLCILTSLQGPRSILHEITLSITVAATLQSASTIIYHGNRIHRYFYTQLKPPIPHPALQEDSERGTG